MSRSALLLRGRLRLRHRMAVVAHEAGRLFVENLLVRVQAVGHEDHLARDLLLGFGVAGEVSPGMTEVAAYAQGRAVQPHDGNQLARRQVLQYLEVPGLRWPHASRATFPTLLRRAGYSQQNERCDDPGGERERAQRGTSVSHTVLLFWWMIG